MCFIIFFPAIDVEMESVHIRQRGAYDFESHYDSVCALHDCCPLPAVKAHLSQGILDLNGDKIRWELFQMLLKNMWQWEMVLRYLISKPFQFLFCLWNCLMGFPIFSFKFLTFNIGTQSQTYTYAIYDCQFEIYSFY